MRSGLERYLHAQCGSNHKAQYLLDTGAQAGAIELKDTETRSVVGLVVLERAKCMQGN